jgi:hypothetical protein
MSGILNSIYDTFDFIKRFISKILVIIFQKIYDIISYINEALFIYVFQTYILFKKNVILFVIKLLILVEKKNINMHNDFFTNCCSFTLIILGALVQNTQQFCKYNINSR